MGETLESLRRKITGAKELESVVRTMKVLAASNIGQYERAMRSLGDYCRTVEMGLTVYFRQFEEADTAARGSNGAPASDGAAAIDAVIIGSDQGLVGQFNDALADFALERLGGFPGLKRIWAVGERIHYRLKDSGVLPEGLFDVPGSAASITPLLSRIIIEREAGRKPGDETPFYIFHNRPSKGSVYEQASVRLLPLDDEWSLGLARRRWPTKKKPEVMHLGPPALAALVREYLFVVLFRACAESLASENACRLAAMQRAEKNIGELLEELNRSFHRLRQGSIDEELFDVISGFEAARKGKR